MPTWCNEYWECQGWTVWHIPNERYDFSNLDPNSKDFNQQFNEVIDKINQEYWTTIIFEWKPIVNIERYNWIYEDEWENKSNKELRIKTFNDNDKNDKILKLKLLKGLEERLRTLWKNFLKSTEVKIHLVKGLEERELKKPFYPLDGVTIWNNIFIVNIEALEHEGFHVSDHYFRWDNIAWNKLKQDKDVLKKDSKKERQNILVTYQWNNWRSFKYGPFWYITPYATSSADEDQAETYSYMMTWKKVDTYESLMNWDETKKVTIWQKAYNKNWSYKDALLAKKVERIKELFPDTEFSDEKK